MEPRPGQALVRTEAFGVSIAAWPLPQGRRCDRSPFRFEPGYDVVGVVEAVMETGGEREAAPVRPGQRVAALTGVGGWPDRVVLATADLVPVPDGISAEEAEAVLANGVIARRMLAVAALAPGDVVVVLGADGGVASLLVQMARRAGAEVIGEAPKRHLPFVRELGAVPVDRDGDLAATVHAIAPRGAGAVFGHLAGPAIGQSWSLLRKGGIVVSSGHDGRGEARSPMPTLFARITAGRLLPDGRHGAMFAGRRRDPRQFHAELRDDLDAVFEQVRRGEFTAHIARAFPLSQSADALRYARSGVAAGQIVLVPDEA
ncbi:zinc-binding dehydrogenase [Amycolatopsis rubida]|uniref:Zinc-binding dehydrogenase n=1 Tax=Amycolatopsis rubida TaxID=112413 RepID=A0ABX0BLR3_9PSEU|nr:MULTISPECIES: zinc-binding dehydrogenase [Amycolatopsis]MYW90780.1 zinc-binding dehydrogenase [Amycolatopsis rubida]NEC55763.1 zinc-binding dehydrogenase [Amycolatopsis rubida]